MLRMDNMKAVILAGGFGTRIGSETLMKPKPMVEVGGRPILWHIMKIYSYYGINDFIICLGYKAEVIRNYFSEYYLNNADVTFNYRDNSMKVHNHNCEPWNVTLVDTGENVMTGSRIKHIQKYIDDTFMVTYGDGVSDINLYELLEFHNRHARTATVSSYQYQEQFGVLKLEKDNIVNHFVEKPKSSSWVNMGFYVFEPEIFDYIDKGDDVVLENEPMKRLVQSKQLVTYQHYGFWKCMDTMSDKATLDKMWLSDPKWAVWKNEGRMSS